MFRQSLLSTIVNTEAVLLICYAVHVALVLVGLATHTENYTIPPCREFNADTVACVTTTSSNQHLLLEMAAQLHEPVWRIVIDNPLLPIFWPLPYGTDVYVSRREPAHVDFLPTRGGHRASGR
jgi:hypothetical protein